MFWIHGGGWQVGDKSDVAEKPKVLTERGFVFVSTNYRLLPEVTHAQPGYYTMPQPLQSRKSSIIRGITTIILILDRN